MDMTHDSLRNIFLELMDVFGLKGKFVSYYSIKAGNINDTYSIITDEDGSTKQYIVQRVNHAVFPCPERIAASPIMNAVLSYFVSTFTLLINICAVRKASLPSSVSHFSKALLRLSKYSSASLVALFIRSRNSRYSLLAVSLKSSNLEHSDFTLKSSLSAVFLMRSASFLAS